MSAAIKALHAFFTPAGSGVKPAEAILSDLFNSKEPFLSKIATFDNCIQTHQALEPVSEYLFDLMMGHHLERFHQEPNFFESKEWMDIEDKTLERGTELLNLLLYIIESKDAEVVPTLEDFLHEFLLVDEDEFQDEHRIYEPLIAYQEAGEAELESLREIEQSIAPDSEIKELFVPIVCFFQYYHLPTLPSEVTATLSTDEQSIVLALLAYYHA
ncbi:MAG: hypothetical protein MUE96_04400 [Bacteroidia bacterium]|jgi:hypothetical protein|nr:hypothetical protein [Bacteroidia bacterium]